MKRRDQIAPETQLRLRWDEELPDNFPNRIPSGKFIWHNHIVRFRGMNHGTNGFRYWFGFKPVNYHNFERCNCGVTDLPHYKIRGYGPTKRVTVEEWARRNEEFRKSLLVGAAR